MIVALASPSSASSLWYLTRGTGTVALVLLTAVLVLGILARGGSALPACPRFVTPAVHRNLSLLGVAFIVVHVVTAATDPYAPIRLLDGVLPFFSAYRPIWLGLGAVTFDIFLAVILTSLLRARLGHRVWRAVHWAAYASWPIAVAHGLGSGSDARTRWLLSIVVLCGLSVMTAVLWRVVGLRPAGRYRQWTAIGLTFAVPLTLVGFAVVGPLAPRWAARAGTPSPKPVTVVDPGTVARTVTKPSPTARPAPGGRPVRPHGVGTFQGRSIVRHRGGDVVVFAGPLRGVLSGSLRMTLHGYAAPHGGINLLAGSVAYVRGAARYVGRVTTIRGDKLGATLAGPAGDLRMLVVLRLPSAKAFTGRVTLS
jgi:methionine sulfoxide reductase heme-binding subunit